MKRLTILVVALAFLGAAPQTLAAGRVANGVILDPIEARASAEGGGIVLIDIRRPSEWRETGVATPARTITMHDPAGPNAFLAAVVEAVGGNLDRPVALICASGVRSTWAQRFLSARGFRRVYNVKEGMLGTGSKPGWIKRGLPIRAYIP